MHRAAFLFGLMACSPMVQGDGNVITGVEHVQAFSELRQDSPLDISIVRGSEYTVELICDANLLRYFSARVEGRELVISRTGFGQLLATEPCRANVYIPEDADLAGISSDAAGDLETDLDLGLSYLDVSGSGGVRLANVWTSRLEIDIEGSGDVRIDTVNGALDAELEGAGELFLGTVDGSVGIEIDGSGGAVIDDLLGESLDAELHGSGDLLAAGAVGGLSLKMSGSGETDLFDLLATHADVRMSGSGDAHLDVEQTLSARISGSGDLILRNPPEQEDVRSPGSGELRYR